MPVKKQKKVKIIKNKGGTSTTKNITRRSGKKITKFKHVDSKKDKSHKELGTIPLTQKEKIKTKTNKKGQQVEKTKSSIKNRQKSKYYSKPSKLYGYKGKKVDGKKVKSKESGKLMRRAKKS
tara:strand:+ start:1440 stop:1805 length:366 start_codon:yes stop_codon:yes gene_type:complete